MSPRDIEVWGTFDVANLGDLLYPLVLERELRARGCDADLHLASPHGGAMPLGDGRPVRRITTADERGFAKQADVDGIVLGGGDLFGIRTYRAADLVPGASGPYRFDPFVGELALLAASTPVVWNGVGVPIPFAEPASAVARIAAARSRYVSVRDEPSRELLIAAGVDREISVVPDPALVVDRVWTRAELAAAIERLRARGAYPASGPILAFHVSFTDLAQETELAHRLCVLLDRHRDLQIALLPLGLCHGDGARVQRLAEALGPRSCAAAGDVTAIELVAAIVHAVAFIGSSLHGNVVAARFGVPHAFLMLPAQRPHKLVAASARLGREAWNIVDGLGLLAVASLLLDGLAPVDAARIDALAAVVDRHYDDLVAALSATGRAARGPDFLADLGPARITAAAGAVAQVELPGVRGSAPPLVAADHRDEPGSILRIARLRAASLNDTPYRWGMVGDLFALEDQRALFEEYPVEPFVTIAGDDGEKGYEYEARNLVPMGVLAPWRPDQLSEPWFRFATDLCTPAYRDALSALTGVALDDLVMEANVFHYAPRAWLGPHVDLREKVVTHVLYFNLAWDVRDGGCLRVLASDDYDDVVAELPPLAGSSSVLVRSDSSWHTVTPVVATSVQTRRSVTVTFYPRGTTSTMWPPN